MVYKKVPRSQCLSRTGKNPITVRWVDINKGDALNPNYRSRLTAREIKKNARPDLFAATPPIEALKCVLSIATSGSRSQKIMINDVKRAYFYAPAVREVYVEICPEDRIEGEGDVVGLLQYSMYGTRDAAQNWQGEFSGTLLALGFTRGKSSPCLFWHKEKCIRTFVHGDDYVSTGEAGALQWLKAGLEEKYDMKTQVLGEGNEYEKEARILNRLLQWHDGVGISYEPDPRHSELIIKQMGLEGAKSVNTLGVKEDQEESEGEKNKSVLAMKARGILGAKKLRQDNEGNKVQGRDATAYRGIAARANFLAIDRADIMYAVMRETHGSPGGR
jgi:hypothetical protein